MQFSLCFSFVCPSIAAVKVLGDSVLIFIPRLCRRLGYDSGHGLSVVRDGNVNRQSTQHRLYCIFGNEKKKNGGKREFATQKLSVVVIMMPPLPGFHRESLPRGPISSRGFLPNNSCAGEAHKYTGLFVLILFWTVLTCPRCLSTRPINDKTSNPNLVILTREGGRSMIWIDMRAQT